MIVIPSPYSSSLSCAAFAFDEIGDAQILLLERDGGVDEAASLVSRIVTNRDQARALIDKLRRLCE